VTRSGPSAGNPPRLLPVERPEQIGIDAVWNHPHPLAGNAERHRVVAQRLGDRDHPRHPPQRPAELRPAQGVGGEQRQQAAQGEQHRHAEELAEQRRGEPFRVDEVGVDGVEAKGFPQPPDRGQRPEKKKEAVEAFADRGHRQKARVEHADAVLHLLARHPGAVARPQPGDERKPGDRRHHGDLHLRRQAAHPLAHEHAVVRLRRVRVDGREDQ
jgi:hypothetical protein